MRPGRGRRILAPGSWSASTSTRGRPSRARAPSPVAFMGALGTRTSLPFGTAVVCPGFRYHPVVIAHAAATLGAMFPGRFYLGLGAGEALNEHVVGPVWPEIGVRSAMMFESIEIINKLFTGNVVRHRGEHFTVESAKLYTRPEKPVPIYVATAGPDQREEDRQVRRRDHHGRGRGREGQHALAQVRGRRPGGGQGPLELAEDAPDPRLLGADRRGGDRPGRPGVAQRRDGLPEAGHQEPRGLRRDGQARPVRNTSRTGSS